MTLPKTRKTLVIFISIYALFGISATLSAQTLNKQTLNKQTLDIYKITSTLSSSQQKTLLQGTPLTIVHNKNKKTSTAIHPISPYI